MMPAYEHREAAEELLKDASDAELGSARERYALDAANTHALIYLGMQFGVEHDPTATQHHIVEEAQRSADLHLKNNPRRPVTALNAARLERRRGDDAS